MQTITADTHIGEIVRSTPNLAKTFESLGIDYCCGGKIPLAEACKEKGLDPKTVIAMLSAMDHVADESIPDVDLMSLSSLCEHIQETHHAHLRNELPRLSFLVHKVASVHGDHEPRLLEIRDLFDVFQEKVSSHTEEENEKIFPLIEQLDADGTESTKVAPAIKDLLAKLEQDHDTTGATMEKFRALSDDYTPPEWGCNTFHALYDGLADLERNMHIHVHKENNVLFPKARTKAEEKLQTTVGNRN